MDPRPNYFSTWHIDRAAERRRDAAWLADQLGAETTRFIPVWKLHNLFAGDQSPGPVFLGPGQAAAYLTAPDAPILLGVQAGRTYFALDVPLAGEAPPAGLAELGQFRELRQMAALLDEEQGALLGLARAMVYWHARHHFCGACGSPTQGREGGYLRTCTNPACGQQHFPHTDPAIIVLVTYGERCLLGHKPIWPVGMYSNVAGFVEPGESLEDAVAREVREETGVYVQHIAYHSSQPWPFPAALMLGFTAIAAHEAIQVDQDEFEDARWFTRADMRRRLQEGTLRLPMRFSLSYRMIEDWFDAGDCGPLAEL
jgi:NAD+ diphosphatase